MNAREAMIACLQGYRVEDAFGAVLVYRHNAFYEDGVRVNGVLSSDFEPFKLVDTHNAAQTADE